MSSLIHIVGVERVACADLSFLIFLSRCRVQNPSDVNFTKINIVGLGQLTSEDDVDNLQTVTAITLKFNVCPLDNAYGRFYAYRITSASGQRYLVGCSDRPFPLTKCSRPFPDSGSGSVLQTVTVSLKSTLPLLFIAD